MSSPQHHKINPPWGRVSGCLQCNTSTQSYVCCGHSPGKSPPSSLPTCAALAPAAAGLSAAASPLSSRISPASKAAASLFSHVEPHVPPWGPAGCSLRFSVGVGDGGPSALGFTGPTVTTRKRPTSDAQEPPRNDAASSPHLWKQRAGRGGVCAPCFYISKQL